MCILESAIALLIVEFAEGSSVDGKGYFGLQFPHNGFISDSFVANALLAGSVIQLAVLCVRLIDVDI